jgi:acetolactate decarboxylase
MIDHGLIHALHVERLRRDDLGAEEREPHAVFQTSTLDALLGGAYEGDVTFADLAARGDLGLGTLDGLDGEMIALDGAFYRAGTDGSVRSIGPDERTPFAVITRFSPDAAAAVAGPLDHAGLLERIESLVADRALCYAVRFDGRFERVHARSVPRQRRPYPPLSQVVARQVEFDLDHLSGTLVGFRFPDYVQGLNVPGYHLHVISDDRSRGGHVLDCGILDGRISVDHSSHLHMELPAGVAWTEPDTSAAKRGLITGAEGGS